MVNALSQLPHIFSSAVIHSHFNMSKLSQCVSCNCHFFHSSLRALYSFQTCSLSSPFPLRLTCFRACSTIQFHTTMPELTRSYTKMIHYVSVSNNHMLQTTFLGIIQVCNPQSYSTVSVQVTYFKKSLTTTYSFLLIIISNFV